MIKIFPSRIATLLPKEFTNLQEIRMRVQSPFILRYKNDSYYVTKMGQLSKNQEDAYIVTQMDLRETIELASNHSLYAYEDEIRQGFLTIQGGHRIGIAGKTIIENGYVRGMKYISYLNIRIAHEVKGCADSFMPYIYNDGVVMQTLIISPPRCGKTTVLRDIVRQLSDLYQCNVGVVDERSEIGACYMGVPQNDIGIRTDLLDGCPKAEGMMMLIRSMSPDVIIADEIGKPEDMKAIENCSHAGVSVITSAHGYTIEDVQTGYFDKVIFLTDTPKPGSIREVMDV